MAKIVVDTSLIINGQMIPLIESKAIKIDEIIIPQVVIDELQSQATKKMKIGIEGLTIIKKIRDMFADFECKLTILGSHSTPDEISLANSGRIDAIITDVAKQNQAILYTSDHVQYLVARAEGIESEFLAPMVQSNHLDFLKFFDSETMSIHLKENICPMGKKGKPGSFVLTKLSEETLTKDYLESMASQIIDYSKTFDDAIVEISKKGAYVIQYRDYRIAITFPPFSESYEITIVHPIVKLSLDDYTISEELMKRFSDQAEGIIISGPPGSGKSTLASGLANFYQKKGKIVKTFESPRDLQVDPGITQYNKLDGSFENTSDILLLVRPDYTIFDEVRRREDFRTFADLRLTGVGMVGVVHANSPIDAIQRFIGKIELGIIPSVIDTVVFVKAGKIEKVYDLELKVKVPTGMTESDLARPVIEIKNFEDHTLEHEIYSFGEENVIVPISKKSSKIGIEKLASDKVREFFKKFDPKVEVEILSENRVKVMVDKNCIASIIGRNGSNINEIEKILQIHIDVVEKDLNNSEERGGIPFTFSETKTAILLKVDKEYSSMSADIYVQDSLITSVQIGKKGRVTLPKHSEVSRNIIDRASSKNDIKIVPKDF